MCSFENKSNKTGYYNQMDSITLFASYQSTAMLSFQIHNMYIPFFVLAIEVLSS